MKQILIIDDEKDILRSVNAILTEVGYKCYEALNSSEAFNIYNSKSSWLDIGRPSDYMKANRKNKYI